MTLLLVPLYTRVLSPGDYGIIDMLAVASSLINLTVALEISQGVVRYFAEEKEPRRKIDYASTALIFTLATYSIFLFFALLFKKKIANLILGATDLQPIVTIALLSMWASGIFYLLQNQLRWQLQPKHHAITSIVFTTVSIFFAVVLIFIFRMGVVAVFYGKATGFIVGSLIAFYFARKSYRLSFKWQRLREMLSFSLPLVPASIAVFVATFVDRIAITSIMGLADVGIYGIGYRFASIVSLIMVGFQKAMMPLVYANYKNQNTPLEISRIFNYFLSIIISLIVLLALFSKETLIIFTTRQYFAAASIIPILASSIVLSSMYIFAPGLGIAKKTKHIALIYILTAIANSILNFVLIPPLGIMGAALATLISASCSFALYMFLSQKFYKVPYNWYRIAGAALIGISIVIFASNVELTLLRGIIIKILLFAVSSVAVVLLLVGVKEVKVLLSKINIVFGRK